MLYILIPTAARIVRNSRSVPVPCYLAVDVYLCLYVQGTDQVPAAGEVDAPGEYTLRQVHHRLAPLSYSDL